MTSLLLKGQTNDDLHRVKQLMESFRYEEAARAANRVLETDSNNVAVLLIKGMALASGYKFREARSVLARVVRIDTASIPGWFNLVNIYRQLGNYDLAVYACKRAVALDPGNRFFLLQLAGLYLNNDDFEKGRDILLPVYRTDTNDLYVLKQLGNCCAELKKPDSAIFWYRKVIELYPSDAAITGKLVNIYIKGKAFQQGLDIAERYLSIDSANTGILQLNGFCRYQLKDYSQAERRFIRSIASGDDSRFARKYLGLCYYKQEMYDKAEPQFRQAFRMDTTDAEICFYYGVSAYRSMLVDTGLVYLNKTLGLIMPSDKFLSSLYLELAGAYNISNQSDTALAILMQARELQPQNDLFLFRIAYQYDFFMNKPKEALAWYRQFLQKTGIPEGDPARLSQLPVEVGKSDTGKGALQNTPSNEEQAAGLNLSRTYSNREFAARRVEELTTIKKSNIR